MGFQYRTFKQDMRFWPVASSDMVGTSGEISGCQFVRDWVGPIDLD